MVEGNFATSGQGRPSESTSMWLSGPTGMQPRLLAITRFFIALPPQRKSGAGWLAGLGGREGASHRAPQSWLFPGRFLGRPYVANSTELHWFLSGNRSPILDFVLRGHDPAPPQVKRPSPHRRLGPAQSERRRLRCGRLPDRRSHLPGDDPRETQVEVVRTAFP